MAWSVAQISLVTLTGVPEFGLSTEQTELIAKASQKVARHFPSVLTEKQQDISGLVMALGSVAFVQARAYGARKEQERAAKASAGIGHNGGPVMQPAHMGGGIQ